MNTECDVCLVEINENESEMFEGLCEECFGNENDDEVTNE